MSEYDRSLDRNQRVERLREASNRKSEEAQARARRAIIALETLGRPINFNTVSAEGNVSKDFLYRNQDIRRRIVDRRRPPAVPVSPSPRAKQSREASAQAKLAVAVTAIQKLRAENEQLRNENARLQGDLLQARRKAR